MKRLLLTLSCIELYMILIEVHVDDSHMARSYITNHGDVNVVVKLKEHVAIYGLHRFTYIDKPLAVAFDCSFVGH